MKNLKSEINCVLTFGFLLMMQISFAQNLVVRPNDATSNHLMVEPLNTFFGAFFGYQAGSKNLGCCNTFIGSTTGGLNSSGIENTFLGTGAGEQNVSGSGNTYLGRFAGRLSTGSRNVFVGRYAGYFEQGNDQLYIDNGFTSTPLIHGFFAKDSLVINGDLNPRGELITGSLDVSNITGVLGTGYSSIAPVVADNTVEVEIAGLSPNEILDVLITSSIGFEIDTFTLPGVCMNTHVGYTEEFPVTFETDNPSDIASLNILFANPVVRGMNMRIKDSGGNETNRYNFYEFIPSTTSPGSGGRTSFTFKNNIAPNNSALVEYDFDLGSMHSYNPATDKIVEVDGITHDNFTPAVQVDYAKRVITLEMTFDEGEGLIPWIYDVSGGTGQKKTMTISETTNGITPLSSEIFSEVLPFKFEVIYGFGLDTKLVARIQFIYGCNEPGP